MTKRKTVNTLELLSINGLCQIVGVSEHTAANWIENFNTHIPQTTELGVTYYHPEAIETLKFIKACKNKNYQTEQIKEMLANKISPITMERTIEDVQESLDQGNYKENILTVMQTIGKTVSNVADQEKSIKSLEEQHNEQNKRIKDMEKQAKEINNLKQEIKALKQEQTPAKEYEIKKESFAKLFEQQKEDHDCFNQIRKKLHQET
ncbi:MerR family transcriptional regulator [Virgibacillus sp. NKC19-3]|uniref:helix-turn-helix domain-containing protein n=1 Tax=Virgibacillus saliphilus TaxID=2831674 RepID=UPI001C9B2DE2|nr:helix-turn-helix domain-containing protein [Virgibacillus sp. NKC19-3]MBY7144346.1 MerR family transcriptional regulator [Virgibacillus sp. NKC19-3]